MTALKFKHKIFFGGISDAVKLKINFYGEKGGKGILETVIQTKKNIVKKI